jgi:hypothetical protein
VAKPLKTNAKKVVNALGEYREIRRN